MHCKQLWGGFANLYVTPHRNPGCTAQTYSALSYCSTALRNGDFSPFRDMRRADIFPFLLFPEHDVPRIGATFCHTATLLSRKNMPCSRANLLLIKRWPLSLKFRVYVGNTPMRARALPFLVDLVNEGAKLTQKMHHKQAGDGCQIRLLPFI